MAGRQQGADEYRGDMRRPSVAELHGLDSNCEGCLRAGSTGARSPWPLMSWKSGADLATEAHGADARTVSGGVRAARSPRLRHGWVNGRYGRPFTHRPALTPHPAPCPARRGASRALSIPRPDPAALPRGQSHLVSAASLRAAAHVTWLGATSSPRWPR